MTRRKIRKTQISIVEHIKVLVEQGNMDEAWPLLDYIDENGEDLFNDEYIEGKSFRKWYDILNLLAEGFFESVEYEMQQ